jgi:phosphate transport system substrate-binding protein
MASRALKPDEAEGIQQYQIAIDVIAVVVHKDNPVDGLTMIQLHDIYVGNVDNWRDVGGPDLPIVVVTRAETSGTRGAFDDIVLAGQSPGARNLKIAVTAGDDAALVGGDVAAIGYVGFGNIDSRLKVLAIENATPTRETARDGTYPLKRPLLLLTGPLSQPLAQQFIDFALSAEGQKVVEDSGWLTAK